MDEEGSNECSLSGRPTSLKLERSPGASINEATFHNMREAANVVDLTVKPACILKLALGLPAQQPVKCFLKATAMCKTSNIVYLGECRKCGIQYVGENEEHLTSNKNEWSPIEITIVSFLISLW